MRFSIILPTYNCAESLSKALGSIWRQDYNNYEVIVVDGRSTDDTLRIIKDYEKKFGGRLRWVSEADKGIYDAMNKGVDLAKGEWIYFLGSDDVLYSRDVLEKVSKEIKKSGVDVIYGNVQWGDSDEIYDGKFSTLKLMEKNICHQSIFYRKTLFEALGKFDLKYKIWADYLFNIRWFNNIKFQHKYVDLIIAKYGIGGVSKDEDEQFLKDRDKINVRYFPKEYIELNQQIKQKNEEIWHKEQELKGIKASFFWKLRNILYRFKH